MLLVCTEQRFKRICTLGSRGHGDGGGEGAVLLESPEEYRRMLLLQTHFATVVLGQPGYAGSVAQRVNGAQVTQLVPLPCSRSSVKTKSKAKSASLRLVHHGRQASFFNGHLCLQLLRSRLVHGHPPASTAVPFACFELEVHAEERLEQTGLFPQQRQLASVILSCLWSGETFLAAVPSFSPVLLFPALHPCCPKVFSN